MKNDRFKWNEKYRTRRAETAAATAVMAHHHLAPMGKALDIASGAGGNARFLAERGYVVEAIDIADAALRGPMNRHCRIHAVCADLDAFDLPRNRYALVINIRYLNRRLFPQIQEALIPGGLVIFETFLETAAADGDTPRNRNHLLRTNELLHAFLRMDVLFYREAELPGEDGRGRSATLAARRPRMDELSRAGSMP